MQKYEIPKSPYFAKNLVNKKDVHTFNTVNDGAGKIVGRVNFVFVSCGRMGLGFASINSRIPHTTIVRKHVHFGSDRTFLTRLRSFYHLGPKFQIQFHRVGPIFGIGPKVKIELKVLDKGQIKSD